MEILESSKGYYYSGLLNSDVVSMYADKHDVPLLEALVSQ